MRLALVGALVLLALGCGGTIRVRARVVHPARLEIAAGEQVAIVHAGDAFGAALAAALEGELRARGIDATVASASDAAGLRGTLLVLTVVLDASLRTEWTTRPESVCGAYGCYIRNVSQPIDMPYLVATFEARIEDAASRNVLERMTGSAETVGTGDGQNRRRLVAQVVAKILDGMEPHTESLRIAFESADDERIDAALEAVHAGDFTPARAALVERLAQRDGLDERLHARLAYDLALVLALDPSSREREGAYASALEHAETSVRLDPTSRHIAALARVRQIVEEARVEDARRTRVPSGASQPGIPDVPDAYRGTIPPPP